MMGADLDLCVEVQLPNGVWATVSVSKRIYRGMHNERLRDAGHKFTPSGDIGCDTADALFNEDLYWCRWMTGADFVAFADAHFGQYVPCYTYKPDDVELFAVSDTVLALVEMVRWLVMRSAPVRVVYWYGP